MPASRSSLCVARSLRTNFALSTKSFDLGLQGSRPLLEARRLILSIGYTAFRACRRGPRDIHGHGVVEDDVTNPVLTGFYPLGNFYFAFSREPKLSPFFANRHGRGRLSIVGIVRLFSVWFVLNDVLFPVHDADAREFDHRQYFVELFRCVAGGQHAIDLVVGQETFLCPSRPNLAFRCSCDTVI